MKNSVFKSLFIYSLVMWSAISCSHGAISRNVQHNEQSLSDRKSYEPVSKNQDETQREKFDRLHANYLKEIQDTHAQLIELKKNKSEIVGLVSELNVQKKETANLWSKLAKALSSNQPHSDEMNLYTESRDQESEIEQHIENKFPILQTLPFLISNLKNEAEFSKNIDREILPRQLISCFDTKAMVLKENKSCRSEPYTCSIFSRENSKLFVTQYDLKLEPIKIETENYNEFLDQTRFKRYRHENYLYCQLSALVGEKSVGKILPPKEVPGWIEATYDESDSTLTKFQKSCVDGEWPDVGQQLKLKQLAKTDKTNSEMMKDFLERLESRKTKCRIYTKFFCENVEIKGDQALLHYTTVNCTIRSVTEGDIQKDVADLKRWRSEEAEIIRRSEIGHTIAACVRAKKNGFTWDFAYPSLKGCKKGTN